MPVLAVSSEVKAEKAPKKAVKAQSADGFMKEDDQDGVHDHGLDFQMVRARRRRKAGLSDCAGGSGEQSVKEAAPDHTINIRGKSRGSRADVCDRCDGPHPSDQCPFFKSRREEHKDAWANYGTGGEMQWMGRGGESFTPKRAHVVQQPGDGSCLFHSLHYGLGPSSSASAKKLRKEIASFIHRNPNLTIAGDTLEEWVRYDGNASLSSYAAQMSSRGWGGGIEMAACSRLKGVNIHVYERAGSGFKLISCFDTENPAKTIHVLYQGGVHYDALCFT